MTIGNNCRKFCYCGHSLKRTPQVGSMRVCGIECLLYLKVDSCLPFAGSLNIIKILSEIDRRIVGKYTGKSHIFPAFVFVVRLRFFRRLQVTLFPLWKCGSFFYCSSLCLFNSQSLQHLLYISAYSIIPVITWIYLGNTLIKISHWF